MLELGDLIATETLTAEHETISDAFFNSFQPVRVGVSNFEGRTKTKTITPNHIQSLVFPSSVIEIFDGNT